MNANPRTENALRLLLAALLTAGLLGAPAMLTGADKSGDKKSEVADRMTVVNDNFKKLRREARNKEFNDGSIKLATEMVAAAKAAKELDPPLAEKMSGAEKQKFIEAYKKEMDGLIAELQGLEKALTEKRYDDAVKSLEKLTEIKKKGHDKFVEE